MQKSPAWQSLSIRFILAASYFIKWRGQNLSFFYLSRSCIIVPRTMSSKDIRLALNLYPSGLVMLSLPLGYISSSLYTVVCFLVNDLVELPLSLMRFDKYIEGTWKVTKGRNWSKFSRWNKEVASWRERVLASQWISAGLVIRLKLCHRVSTLVCGGFEYSGITRTCF